MVDRRPVEAVPGDLLSDDVAIDVVVDAEVRQMGRYVGQVGKLVADIGRAEREAVPEHGEK